MQVYDVRPGKDNRGVDLISDALPFGRLWYGGAEAISNAIGYAKHRSRSHDAVIHVCDAASDALPLSFLKTDAIRTRGPAAISITDSRPAWRVTSH
jgi:hypothetical protein